MGFAKLRPRPPRRWTGHDWDAEIVTEDSVTWSFVELTSGEELVEEGRILNHCVATYSTRCVAGHSAIVSMREEGKNCLTLELHPATKTVVQARGNYNRDCTPAERNLINQWLSQTVQKLQECPPESNE